MLQDFQVHSAIDTVIKN